MTQPILDVNDLRTYFYTSRGVVKAVDGVSFQVGEKESLGIVGESGCGKSMTAFSVMRLIPVPPGRIVSGKITLRNKNLLQMTEEEMRKVRGADISMIFQDPITFLNPVIKVGEQISETIQEHQNVSKKDARRQVIEALEKVKIPSPQRIFDYYPHQLSGGMRQRALIAMAISSRPAVLIADEPTTALDTTVQAQILNLILELKEELGTSLILITHDLGIVAEICDRVSIMYAGRIIEVGDVYRIFKTPRHPYATGLLKSILRIDEYKETLPTIEGNVPDLMSLPKGCKFQPRCPKAMPICSASEPNMIEVKPGHQVGCWLYK